MLFIDITGAFDHVRRNELMRKMEVLVADGDLVRWIGSFIWEKGVSIIVDSHYCEVVEV